MKILVTHIRNEEYYLKWWLPHHKNKFDLGIIIDYHSTDNTHKLIKQICPDWMILPSRYEDFDALHLDAQVNDTEETLWKTFPGAWITTLTVTEFLIGDTSFLDSINKPTCLYLPQSYMVDKFEQVDVPADPNIPLHKQRTNGVPWTHKETSLKERGKRVIRNYNHHRSPTGRHWKVDDAHVCNELAVLWYGYSPYTQEMINRHEKVSELMTQRDIDNRRMVTHHPAVRRYTFRRYQKYIEDLSDYISQYES